ncbi:MAG: MFS transporter, partial [Novosphingobium sp.]|nr:MFS transporter [Novosphingobium sp.]
SEAQDSEWRIGWRIMLACAIANGTGIALVFYVFSMFLLPMAAEMNMTRSETSMIQALVVTAALGAPVIGRLTDLLGFRTVYLFCALVLGVTGIVQGTLVSDPWLLGVTVAVSALFGSGVSGITLTRPINAHFVRYRGRALGLVGIGVSITAVLVPPVLHEVIVGYGWRAGFISLAIIGLGIGLPAVMLLMPREAAVARAVRVPGQSRKADWSFLSYRDFWLLAASNAIINVATAGAVSQMSPMIQDEGLSAGTAALAVSIYAMGQFVGKLGGGWLLDHFEPRRISSLMILVPTTGFAILFAGDGMLIPVLVAVGMIGLLHGADIDIFAYFSARRFGIERYGAAFGALHGIGWIGTVGGILAFGSSFDQFGSYAPVQGLSLILLAIGALMFLPVRLPPLEARE